MTKASKALDKLLAITNKRSEPKVSAAGARTDRLVDKIKVGSRVTIVDRFGKKHTGKVPSVLDALAEVTAATTTLMRQGTVKAAKDSGSSGKDKERAAKVASMVAKAEELKENVDLSGFPEAKSACEAVASLKAISMKLAEAQIKIKAAPAKTEEAKQAQEAIDELRDNLDTMISPLSATMDTMEALLLAAADLEDKFAAASDEIAAMKVKLKSDKVRLAAISKAVEQAAKIG